MALIQEVPIAKYQSVTGKYTHNDAMRALLEAYRQQLIEAAEFLKAKDQPAPAVMIRAIESINNILGFKGWHWVGAVQPDDGSPSFDVSVSAMEAAPRSEEAAYQELIRLVGHDRTVADRLIDLERNRYPFESRVRSIERAIQRLTRDRR